MTAMDMPQVGGGRIGRPPERLRVTVRQRIMREMVTEDVTWPKGWPLPDQGAVFQGHVLQGWVEHVEFDVRTERVIVVLR